MRQHLEYPDPVTEALTAKREEIAAEAARLHVQLREATSALAALDRLLNVKAPRVRNGSSVGLTADVRALMADGVPRSNADIRAHFRVTRPEVTTSDLIAATHAQRRRGAFGRLPDGRWCLATQQEEESGDA